MANPPTGGCLEKEGKEMKTQILIAAGGKGVRLGDMTKCKPKSLIIINERPIIDHIVISAQNASVNQVVVGIDGGKEELERHLNSMPVEIENDCVEPLTTAFFRSAEKRRPDIIIGTNGDTIYRPESIIKVVNMLINDEDAAAALLLTDVVRPLFSSTWTYWRHRIKNRVLVSMDEVPGHQITTEYVVTAFRVSSLQKLSRDFTESFSEIRSLPFHCYSLGWDFILKLLLWKKFRVVSLVSHDLSLNINFPRDLKEGKYFFSDPELFRKIRMIPDSF